MTRITENHISHRLRAQARERLERVACLCKEGFSITDIARQEGVSRQRIYDLIENAKREGML